MFTHQLFLGLPVSVSYGNQLGLLPKSLRDAFIQQDSSDYLRQIESDGVTYLGKCVESPLVMDALESMETHIISLLKMLIPDYPYHEHPLVLLALMD